MEVKERGRRGLVEKNCEKKLFFLIIKKMVTKKMEGKDYIVSNVIRTRGVSLSNNEMRRFRIEKVVNSTADVDYMDEEYLVDMERRSYNPGKGECVITESAIRSERGRIVKVVSIIVFGDVFSMELYALANKDLYFSNDKTLGGKMN